ncbi:MAG: hypothetical protein ACW964_19680 [Candidatus Hodarchaeales archaeon]|jgi:hypothetical protein
MEKSNKQISEQLRISFNLPSGIIFPLPIAELELTPTEQKLYLQLSLEFQKVLDDAPSFQMGAFHWHQILPERLQRYGLTTEVWERISVIGDNNDEIQEQLSQLSEQL